MWPPWAIRQPTDCPYKTMAITFHIPGPLRSFTEGRSHVEIRERAATLSQALQALWAACPGIRDRVMKEDGQIREHINVFVGKDDVRYTGGLATPLPPNADISIIPAVSGGNFVATTSH